VSSLSAALAVVRPAGEPVVAASRLRVRRAAIASLTILVVRVDRRVFIGVTGGDVEELGD
jgi:hypothetical protein